MKKLIFANFPILVIIIAVLLFFYPIWLENKIPMPTELVVGVYYPWLDFKWAGYDAGIPVKNPLLSDIPSIIYPQRLLAIEQLKSGELPLWNPLIFNGYPLMAAFQTATFYPLNILYFILPFIDTWTIGIVLQVPMCAIFMYMFLRSLGISKISASFGSVAYAFSSFNIFWLEYNVHGHVSAYIPLVLYLVNKYLDLRKVYLLVILSVVVAVQIFAGYPQISAYTLILVSFWALYRLNPFKHIQEWKTLVLIIVFLILGLGIAAMQIMPGLELYKYSQRVAETLSAEQSFLQAGEIINIVAPDYYGNPSTKNYWGNGDFASVLLYAGGVAFILALFSLIKIRQDKIILFFWTVFIVCFLLVLETTGTFLINSLGPLSSAFQAASMTRIFIIMILSISTLAALGLDLYRKLDDHVKVRYYLYLPIIFILPWVIGMIFSYMYALDVKQTLDALKDPDPDVLKLVDVDSFISNYKVAFRNLIIPFGITTITLITLIVGLYLKSLRTYLSLFLLLLLITELFRFGWKITPFTEREFVFPTTPVLEYLESQEKPFRIAGGDVLPANLWMPYNLEAADGYDAVYPLTTANILAFINNGNPDSAPSGRVGTIYKYESPMLDLMNIKYIMALKMTGGIPKHDGEVSHIFHADKYKIVYEDKSVAILENSKALPRAFVVTDWEFDNSKSSTLRKLGDENYPRDRKIILSEQLEGTKSSTNSAVVKYLDYKAISNKLEVTTENPGLLFISDTWYPGWKAKVDGEETPILVADYAFRAIPVDKGKHTIEVYYDPDSFRNGMLLSFSSAAILGIILILSIIKTRRLINAKP